MLGKPSLVKDTRFATSPARHRNRDAMHAEIDQVFSKLTAAQVVEKLEGADIANARLNDMNQFWNHPQLKARGRWARVGSPAGDLDLLKPPFNLSGFEPRMDAVPALGEHSERILGELGYGAAEIEALRKGGAI